MLRIGTSGWQYAHWRGRFYPPGCAQRRWLEWYSARFETVEVNNTFYQLPAATTFERWANDVPPEFVFAVKASRYLTHYRRLERPREPVARLLAHSRALGPHHGPVLLQLPPNLERDIKRLDATLAEFGGRVRVAVEFRHDSWFVDEVAAVLRAHDAAACLVDRGSRPRTPLWRTAEWTYVRFHEGIARPRPCYGSHALDSWVRRLEELWGGDVDGYVYFNNDTGGCALRDAIVFALLARDAGFGITRTPPLADVDVQSGDSRTTSSAGLSVRSPRNTGARMPPAAVH